ncbi:hypothetical protein NQ314_012160 [Rhamnusium bicolor]|uniref:Eukaryotic translation initiation factor 4E transporter n=1 Tax=Rhamnusium bicolor TaxID=1586634 RepID=A0AAV8XEA7_9CUCU|nr:hypothetical protein NQ314_012160 [Rhamnusium bicolor]
MVMQNRKRQQKPRVKRVSWRDEQMEGMSVSDVPEFTDPAILVVREIVKIRYTKDELIKLRDAPLSKKKPDFFDASEVKKSETPTENGPRSGDIPDHRRRPGDPRERIRKENDGIVLSPQRRSFNSGCFVPVRDTTRTNRPHSPLGGKNESSHIGVREIQTGTRRIGSGRILRDSWDFNEKSESGDNDYGFRGQQRNNDREDKYERRSFGRDFDINRDRENNNKDNRRNGRYDRRRISENREQEEPEWFSGGPVSQNDTIELRGFEESDKIGSKKKLSPSRVKRAKEWSKKKNEAQATAVEEKEEPKVPAVRSTPTPQAGGGAETSQQQQLQTKPNEQPQASGESENKASSVVNDHAFNFDDILKCDTIQLLTNGMGGDGDNMKSRFSRWFKQESPEKVESRRSSMQDDHNIIKDLLSDIGETSVSIPGDSEAYFAPISPAGNTGGIIGGKRGTHLDELEAKMRQNTDASSGLPQKHQQQKPDEEMTAAFKKLVGSRSLFKHPSFWLASHILFQLVQAQAGGHAVTSNGPMNKTQPMSLLEMLNHSQQQDEAARMSGNPHLLSAASPNIANLHQHASDLTMKLQQAQMQQQKQQMDMLNKLINATVHPQQMRTSPLHDMGMQQSRELLNRPEAQAILQGLKRGEITTQHLYQQLANPALQPRHREMLVTILKMQGGGGGYGPSPRVLSPVPPHHMFQQQQQQQLRVSPLPPNAMHQRIPSPRELQVHTQNILQRALIKKKLEEQQENYRKKQEMQRGQSPNTNNTQGPAKSVSSPTPLAFTPTSVLRKMTADKDEAGRPIVKANNYQTQTPEQFFSQHQQQQQRMFNQPPPGTSQQAQPQRKPAAAQFGGSQAPNGPGGPQSQYNPQYSTNQQFAQQLTQQQLRAQHQHRPANQPMQQQHHQGQHQQAQQLGFSATTRKPTYGGGLATIIGTNIKANRSNPIGRGGISDGDLSPTTTNQLARWFSPDLLERARGGELPSTAGLAQHALSLEEIERQTAPPVHN